jgi:hypothetical protein
LLQTEFKSPRMISALKRWWLHLIGKLSDADYAHERAVDEFKRRYNERR